jgi:hypothetical protein
LIIAKNKGEGLSVPLPVVPKALLSEIIPIKYRIQKIRLRKIQGNPADPQ